MKIQFYYFIICIFVYFSCKQNKADTAPVDETTMVAIMSQVYYMDAHFAELNSYLKDSIIFLKFNVLLDKYKISKEQFRKAQVYYTENEKAHIRLEQGIKKTIENATMK